MGLDPETYLRAITAEEMAEAARELQDLSHRNVEDLIEGLEASENGRAATRSYTRGPIMATRLG